MVEIRHLENRHYVIFVPIWIKFRRLVQNDISTAVMWSKSKPGVEFQYGGHLGEFNGVSSQSHLPHCRVLQPCEFNVMIPELRVTSQGAAIGRIQWHVIPEPRITLQGAATWWIHCHNSRATCHIAGCSHLAKSMSWSCHIAGCKNSIRYIENRSSPYFIFLVFNAVYSLTSSGFRIVSDTLVWRRRISEKGRSSRSRGQLHREALNAATESPVSNS